MNPIIRLTTLATSAFLAAAATACTNEPTVSDNPPPANSNTGIVAGTLEATATRPTLTLRNTTEHVVGYMVVDKDQMVVALYPPCGTNCPKLVQGAQIAIPYANISGHTASSTEATVMWWTYLRAADGSLQPSGAVQTKQVKL